jgi:RNA polymerase sigma-70 factor (ECF subfamily)
MPQTSPPADNYEWAYEAHHQMVYRTAYRITGNATDAEDVMQTVFLRLMRRDSSLRPLEQPEGYLRRAAVNVSLDLLRERQKMADYPLETLSTSDTCTELRDLRDTVRKSLAEVDERHAEMFALRFFEGYTNQEIARLMGVSQVLVAVTLHRLRNRLQKELKKSAATAAVTGKGVSL